jgi:F0F1-type ATP synthase assembly protein I
MEVEKGKKSFNTFARFSSVGIQMGVVIALFTWLGTYLDAKYQNKTPYWSVGLSLFGVLAGLTLVIREVIQLSKKNENK